MMSNDSNPNKKRKANDSRATTDGASTNDSSSFLSSGRRDETSPGPPQDNNKTSQLDRMEEMMMRMEEKLATVSSLERRCENLEAKCSKLEDMLETKCCSEQLERKCSSLETKLATTSQSMKDHMDRSLRYHEMRILNQQWKYPTSMYMRDEFIYANYDDEEADYIIETGNKLKKSTEAMRRGDFPGEDNGRNQKWISLDTAYEDPSSFDEYTNNELSPHWEEFAAALKQFKPAFDMLPDDCETSIIFSCVQLNREMTELIQEALANMPFKKLSLEHTYRIHGGMSTIATITENNKYLQKLDIYQITGMDGDDIAKLCSAIQRHPSIIDVSIRECFSDDGIGNEMLRTLLTTYNLKLERLDMSSNKITSVETTLLPDFLATNPSLKVLDLSNNDFFDGDAALIANALRSNTKLRHLNMEENYVGEDGGEALCMAVRDESSLNSVADSNHSCEIDTDDAACDGVNQSDSREMNRARKIYRLLSSRNGTMSNVKHFFDIDAKLLPNILEAVQKYSRLTEEDEDYVIALSIVYEVMRRWDKVSSLYKTLTSIE